MSKKMMVSEYPVMAKHVYPHLLDPAVYPDFSRRPHRVPTWETFEHTTQFTTLRAFTVKDNFLVNFREDLDLYQRLKLGRLIWPFFTTVFTENFKELVEEINNRGLYLYSIWGHVPGCGPGERAFHHMVPPDGMVEYLNATLGDHFLGIENGEQDGRYIRGFAHQQCPSPPDHLSQYLNFQRHFERMGDDLGHSLSVLVSLCFGHYMIREGNHVLIGAEAAQALPNSQVYYAFIRGAGKQYGIHWFGNASIWNRWGHKTYDTSGQPNPNASPTHGTSLSLLRRLLYTHYLYNCVALGFENGWIKGDDVEKRLQHIPVPMESDRSPEMLSLTPIGQMQKAGVEFVERHRQPGVMMTPVALLLDFFCGWAMPRHQYSETIYNVWGDRPYGTGDYLTHAVLSLLYPGYEDASYYRDERGFLTPTPYGDMTDVLLSDAPAWVLNQYHLIIAAVRLTASLELAEKLEGFVEQGGHLIITAANARDLWPVWEIGEAVDIPSPDTLAWADGSITKEIHPFSLRTIRTPATVVARCGERPAVVDFKRGKGKITVLLSDFGLNRDPLVQGPGVNPVVHGQDGTEAPLPVPFVLLNHVWKVLHEALVNEQMFSGGEGLGMIACRTGNGEYILGIHNNDLFAKPFKIVSHCGPIVDIRELPIDQEAKIQVGYWPTGREDNVGGESTDTILAGGDIRLFGVRVEERNIEIIPPIQPPAPVRDRWLSFPGRADIKEEILAQPTFFQHFDGVKIDWKYLARRDKTQVACEHGWLARQKVRMAVDFSSGLNMYPDLTLLDAFKPDYEQTLAAITDVFDKMKILGARAAVLTLHRHPQTNCAREEAQRMFRTNLPALCRRAAEYGITLHLQHHPRRVLGEGGMLASPDKIWCATGRQILEFIDDIHEANLRFALNTGHACMSGEKVSDLVRLAGDRLGLVLLCAPQTDLFDQIYDTHEPIHAGRIDLTGLERVRVPMILDAGYGSWDEIYRDLKMLR